MKKHWLRGVLLGASLALLLAGGVAWAQQRVLDVGCGTATIDGRVGPVEWANAETVTLWSESMVDEAQGGVAPSQDELMEMGTAYLMHDGTNLFVGAVLHDPEDWLSDDPIEYELWMNFAFEDEPAGEPSQWVDCAWEAESCEESGEGQLVGYREVDPGGDEQGTEFFPWYADHENCWEDMFGPGVPGVAFDAALRGGDTHYEMSINLSTSPLDNVGVGDCFDMRWIWVYNYSEPGERPIIGQFPIQAVDEEPYKGQCTVLCLDPCEEEEEVVEEFVPEPGTLLLLGSGLAGLAGYATLRWKTRE